MEELSFDEYNSRLRRAFSRYPTRIETLPNGAIVGLLGREDAPRLGLLSGVHGDERGGPLAVLRWLETARLNHALEHACLLAAPLVNNLGWNANTREWNGIDLNRSFHLEDAPSFLRALLERFIRPLPFLFLDLHEDSFDENAYVFRLEGDADPLHAELQALLRAEGVPWNWEPEWDGTSEVFLRRQGCPHSITLEVPPGWPLERRIEANMKALDWCLEQMLKFGP